MPRCILKERSVPGHELNSQRICQPCNNRKGDKIIDYRPHHLHEQFLWWMRQAGLEDLIEFVSHRPRSEHW